MLMRSLKLWSQFRIRCILPIANIIACQASGAHETSKLVGVSASVSALKVPVSSKSSHGLTRGSLGSGSGNGQPECAVEDHCITAFRETSMRAN